MFVCGPCGPSLRTSCLGNPGLHGKRRRIHWAAVGTHHLCHQVISECMLFFLRGRAHKHPSHLAVRATVQESKIMARVRSPIVARTFGFLVRILASDIVAPKHSRCPPFEAIDISKSSGPQYRCCTVHFGVRKSELNLHLILMLK